MVNIVNFITNYPEGMRREDLSEDIITAAYYGDLDAIKRAVAECPQSVTFTDQSTGSTALHFSAGLGNYSCVEFLVGCSEIDLFQKDHKGDHALMRAFQIGHKAIITLLADRMYPERHSGIGFEDPNGP